MHFGALQGPPPSGALASGYGPPGKRLGSLRESSREPPGMSGSLWQAVGSLGGGSLHPESLLASIVVKCLNAKIRADPLSLVSAKRCQVKGAYSPIEKAQGCRPHLVVCIALKCRLYKQIQTIHRRSFTPEQPQPLVSIYSWLIAIASKLSDGWSCLPPTSVGVVVGNLGFRVYGFGDGYV